MLNNMNLQIIRSKSAAFLESLSEETAAYLLSIAALVFVHVASKVWQQPSSNHLYWIPLVILIYGFMHFLLGFLKPLWVSVPGKIVISSLFLCGSTISYSIAKILINDVTHSPSSAFALTHSLVS